MRTLNIALSTDAKGHPYHATLLASILRRTAAAVYVRCWCRGFWADSFESGRLRVEFLPAMDDVTGRFPGTSGPAAFDRMLVIRDCPDWDRCMVMDCDQLVLCDLDPLFDLDLADHLLAAHMQGHGVDMAYAMRVWLKRPFPDGWEHVASHPYFLMPPMLNLKAMREAGTWNTFLQAHAAFGADEQLSLTAATGGRTLPLEKKWNLFPKLHIAENEIPEGVIHWSGWPKPWHRGAQVWRPDIWESERSSWEHLRMGLWRKPLAIEVEPEDDRGIRALAARGWRVKVFAARFGVEEAGKSNTIEPRFPDVETNGASVAEFQDALYEHRESIDRVRIGEWEDVGDWLEGSRIVPEHLVLKGLLESAEVDRLRALGYTEEARLMSGEWPVGGPLPRALDFLTLTPGTGIRAGEEAYLRLPANGRAASNGSPVSLGAKPERPQVANPRKVGVCLIATARYRIYIRPLLRSIRRNFLPGHEVTVFLFTDGDVPPAADLEIIPVAHEEWPGMAIRRYPIFREHAARFAEMEYLFYLDADMRVIGKVGEEILDELVGIIHPGFHDKPRAKFTYETRRQSTAYIAPEEGTRYYCGAFQGGTTGAYLDAVRTMAENIDRDMSCGITAVWHDESHWNRYLIDQAPTLRLSPSYCWYPDGRSAEFEGKIAVVLKDAARMRKA